MSPETAILLSLGVPSLGTAPIVLTGHHPNLREGVTLVTAAALFLVVLTLFPHVLSGARPELRVLDMLPGLSIAFRVEPLGLLFATVASFLWIVTSVYSIGYMRGNEEAHQTRYYAYFAVALASAVGVAFAGNMLTLFVFYEILTLSTYPLVAHHGDEEAIRGGRTYLGVLLTTSIGFLLLGMLWTWNLTGTLDFRPGGILQGAVEGPVVVVLLVLYMYGIGKAALMPAHRWLPAAMVAPTPVSALLHAVAVVKAGVFTVVKVIVYLFGFEYLAGVAGSDWLLYAAGFTVIAASVVALRSDNLKRRLAYSTVSQLSYVILAAAVMAPLSVVGAALHIAAHAFGKITLFFAAGSIYTASHKTEVSQLDGIGRRMPWTMAAFAVGSLSMIGVPPTVGFVSKWYILQGALEAGQMLAVAVIVASTLLNAGYYLPIVYAAFLRREGQNPHPGENPAESPHDHGEAPLPIVGALMVSAAGVLLLFLFPDVPLALARQLVTATP